ncbi:BgTH12-06650 [Blumeria graminis f. sp. triticale]|uniref:Bgt-2217 n=3 Tax=Blumeria graminis TaxID=34373 RepID=A0A381LD07_BLUGR|nr:Mitochondrial ribosomal protein [Blumeria graminis f. sp. tritici 96224]CAD6500949.1 BgTH12-06650 [Blumeria graminis f. sp. triticale]VCU41253.1 Bgt-2217 [Blumeria graminis f. sp. tritici]
MKVQSISKLSAHYNRIHKSTALNLFHLLLTRPTSLYRAAPTVATTTCHFSTTANKAGNWLLPSVHEAKKSSKGRPRVPTGGSSRGTEVIYGDYGLRMCDRHRRLPASALKIGEDAIKVRLKGMRYRLYKRVCAQIGVYTKGNEVRMGKGKGSFDYWAARVAVSKIIFEIKGDVHEQVARDAFRLAGNKMPGQYEFVKRGDPPVVGITKLAGVSLEELKKPRRKVPLPMPGKISPETSITTQ